MTLVNLRPAKRNGMLSTNVDRLFDSFFNHDLGTPARTEATKRKVLTNVFETNDFFRLELAAPGLAKEAFKLDVDKDVLSISVDSEVKNVEGEAVKLREFGNYKFEKRYRLAETIDTAGIEAKYENGVLNILLPKKEEAKPQPVRKIEIA